MRACRKGQNKRAQLTDSQIARLDELGMNWVGKNEANWDVCYKEAQKYRQAHGNLKVPTGYVTENGIRLGRWIRSQREALGITLSDTRRQKLDAIGMVWKREDPWMAKYRLLEEYYTEHGHTNMPADFVVNGVWLRRWLSEQKARLNGKPTGKSKTTKKLSNEQAALLAIVGITPERQQNQ